MDSKFFHKKNCHKDNDGLIVGSLYLTKKDFYVIDFHFWKETFTKEYSVPSSSINTSAINPLNMFFNGFFVVRAGDYIISLGKNMIEGYNNTFTYNGTRLPNIWFDNAFCILVKDTISIPMNIEQQLIDEHLIYIDTAK